MRHSALLDALRRLSIPILPGLFDALSEAEAEGIITFAEAGRRHAKTDLDRLDAAIRTLVDVRYDDDVTRSRARKALSGLLDVKDSLGDPADPDAEVEDANPEDEEQALADSKKADRAIKAADKVAGGKSAAQPAAQKTSSGDKSSAGGKSIELKIAASDDGDDDLSDLDDEGPAPQAARGATRRVSMPLDRPSMLAEAQAPTGNTWDVLLIQPGTSKNRRRYRREILQEAVRGGAFNNARAFAPDGPDHFGFGQYGRKRGTKELVGWWSDPRYAESVALPDGKQAEGVVATFHVSEAAEWLRTMLSDSWSRGKYDLVGWSIVGDGDVKVVRGEDGRPVADVNRLDVVESIDPVVNPAAGGRTLRLVASQEGAVDWTRLTLAEAIRGLGDGTILPDELRENRADLARQIENYEAPKPAEDAATVARTVAEAAVAKFSTVQMAEAKIALRPGLAESIKGRIRTRLNSTLAEGSLGEGEIDAIIKDEVDYASSFAPAGIKGAGAASVTDMKSDRDQMVEAAYDGLSGKDPKFSIAKFYTDLTGDAGFTGRYAEGGRLTESVLAESIISSTFDQIMADSVTRRMLDYYNLPGLDAWRSIVNIENIKDFRTYRRTRFGGYGNLPAVAQGGPYTALSTPTDEEATFAISKRGGTEDMTLEAIANDDLGALKEIPRRLGRAAAQTLHEFVFDFLAGNAAIYDSVALFHGTHANLGSTALAAPTLVAGRTAMAKQTDMSNSKRLGISPKTLIVPIDLEQTAYELTATDREVASANNTLNFVRQFGLTVIRVDYWTDANNWFLVADPNAVPTIALGFFNGNQDPELFVQDQPTLGNVFTNDKITYKIRHIYGGAVMDFRGFYGAVVA